MNIKQIMKFLVSGGFAAVVEYVTFLLLQHIFNGQILLVAQTLSFITGFIVSFTLNRSWVFKSTNPIIKDLSKYLILLAINLVVGIILITIFVDGMNIADWLAKIMIMAMIAMWNYFIFQKIIFKNKL